MPIARSAAAPTAIAAAVRLSGRPERIADVRRAQGGRPIAEQPGDDRVGEGEEGEVTERQRRDRSSRQLAAGDPAGHDRGDADEGDESHDQHRHAASATRSSSVGPWLDDAMRASTMIAASIRTPAAISAGNRRPARPARGGSRRGSRSPRRPGRNSDLDRDPVHPDRRPRPRPGPGGTRATIAPRSRTATSQTSGPLRTHRHARRPSLAATTRSRRARRWPASDAARGAGRRWRARPPDAGDGRSARAMGGDGVIGPDGTRSMCAADEPRRRESGAPDSAGGSRPASPRPRRAGPPASGCSARRPP